jgi:phenylpropionate dioxygenase-like ring-hydroxylating dioxygenase large terminal subunit
MATTVSAPRWASRYPELGTEPLPIEPFISREYYELEKERLFRRVWLNVGTLRDIPNPGDYLVKEIKVCDASVLVTHGKHGQIRAFYNVCTHRGNKLVWDERGSTKKYISCCFHGWTFDLEGQLVSVTDEAGFAGLDKSCRNLTPLAVDVWKGFIFVNFDPEPSETLLEYLGPLAEEFENRPVEELEPLWRYEVSEDANWKVAMDAQNEMYHLNILGPVHAWASALYTSSEEGHPRTTTFERYGDRHTLWGTGLNPDFQAQGLLATFSEKVPPPKIQMPTRGGFFDYFVVFPNMVIALLADQMVVYNFLPEAYNRVTWQIWQYGIKPDTAAQLLYQHFWKAKIRDIVSEDIASHETVHSGLASRALRNIVVQDEEIQIRAFHDTVRSYVGPADGA